ncbi:fumarylacetoacetase [Endozoicomonas sp. 4G]|uniref:fumarylacetoacetase n=1 Tax=Endozoicomonas sp. 4G TaxID=2872754 RepID=UPI0020786FB6|nr:fumarylacetoacetase [Endozoicomonas sp. 4G]
MISLNETHDVNLTSWVSCANTSDTDFPIQNLPFAVFRTDSEPFRCGVAIGNQILDLKATADVKPFEGKAADALAACAQKNLNPLMELGFEYWSALRLSLSRALRTGSELESQLKPCLITMNKAEFALPCQIRDYTDFYSSIHHAKAVGSLFRPDNPLLPNYKWVPIGYHGRASSIEVSGQTFHRPAGQTKAPDAESPAYGPCKRLDYELEMGIFIGQGNQLGNAIALDKTDQHIFGMCLLNDWSARDIQAWEYQPLGPFLAKSFASTISPWIVTLEALAPFRTGYLRPTEDPQPLPYLSSEENSILGALDIQLEVLLQTPAMKSAQQSMEKLSQSSFKHSYWSVGQMVAHHASNGCNLQSGDLLGTGTQSGPRPEEAGSLLELTKGGKEPLTLTNGEQRTFLQDGDTVIMKGWCEKEGAASIGFGEVAATVLPANLPVKG